MRRRRPDPRIVDPATHPQRLVNQTVAAEFLEMPRHALAAYVDDGQLRVEWVGRRKMIRVEELVRFRFWLHRLAGHDRRAARG